MQMRAIGRGSISSFLKVAVDVAWVVSCALLGFIWIVTGISVFALMNGGEPVAAFERIAIDEPARIAVWTLVGTVFCIGAMIICSYLRGVFETLVAGDPFVPDNARRFRSIAIVLAGIEIARMFISLLVQFLLGAFGVVNEGEATITFSLNISVWFSVLTLVVLAQVFKEGAAMREEQKMTI
ncbi:MAG: DUF2975 domain-containing protein [Alphaproteobacteria bacterium]|nr:DUF2975 domain-containing protein [Alphaproteobacteria bacterium]